MFLFLFFVRYYLIAFLVCTPCPLIPETIAFLSMDHTNLSRFFSDSMQVGEKLKCLPDYSVIENDLMEMLNVEFPQQSIRVYKFGSRLSGIGTRESDLDIFIDVGGNFKNFEHRPSKQSVLPLQKLRNAMKLNPKTWKVLLLAESARVPILKVIHTKTGIECDINMTNSLGFINTQLMEYIYSLQPICKSG